MKKSGVKERSLQLFECEPVLEQKLGKNVFEAIPVKPGVYRFYDSRGDLLYVGKAKNLRRRLFSYKNARAGKTSAKTGRLISRIASFVFETTASERDALLLENRLIRTERPPFNHANKQTEAYYRIFFRIEGEQAGFRLAMRHKKDEGEKGWYGFFKGHEAVRKSFGCFLQLLWMIEHRQGHPHDLPVQLTRNLVPAAFILGLGKKSPLKDRHVKDMIRNWLTGKSDKIHSWLANQYHEINPGTLFTDRFLLHHLECLEGFYEKTLVRHRRMSTRFLNTEYTLIESDKLDDLIVKDRFLSDTEEAVEN